MSSFEHLVLVPGMMCDERQWLEQIRYFEGKCSSVSVANTRKADSIERIAEQILEDTPQIFALAGLSMGGIIAFEMWRQAPQRISKIALLDTNASAETPERGEAREILLERVLSGEISSVVADSLKPQYLAEANRDNQNLLNTIMSMALGLGKEVFERQSRALAARPDSVETLESITVPTLVLCGEEDTLCPVSFHELIASHIPQSRLVTLKNCGHLSTMEQPVRVNREMETWLKTN